MGAFAWGRTKIVERWNKSLGTSSTIINLIVLDADMRRDILRPQVEVRRKSYPNDHSVAVRLRVSWLFRSVKVQYDRPFTRTERRAQQAAHDREMAEMRAQNDARRAARQG